MVEITIHEFDVFLDPVENILDELCNYKKIQPFIPFDFQWFCNVMEPQQARLFILS